MDQSEKDELHRVLSMSLYDIMNNLCIQMDKKQVDEDWIGLPEYKKRLITSRPT